MLAEACLAYIMLEEARKEVPGEFRRLSKGTVSAWARHAACSIRTHLVHDEGGPEQPPADYWVRAFVIHQVEAAKEGPNSASGHEVACISDGARPCISPAGWHLRLR